MFLRFKPIPPPATTKSRTSRTVEIVSLGIAYAIPLFFLAYVLYLQYTPFGYATDYVATVGYRGDTDTKNPLYLEPSNQLSESFVGTNLRTYRELTGIAQATFKPALPLSNPTINISVTGSNVALIPPVIDFDPSQYQWDYEWDFRQEATARVASTSERARLDWPNATVPDLVGTAFWFDNGMFFDGSSRLELPNSVETFKNKPFSIYVEWTPNETNEKFSQIIGHYDWELFQGDDLVTFQIGRMNTLEGPFNRLTYQLRPEEIGQANTALLVYKPGTDASTGLMYLYVNNQLAGALSFDSDRIAPDYSIVHGLSFGDSKHGIAQPYDGKITTARISYDALSLVQTEFATTLPLLSEMQIYLQSETTVGRLEEIRISVNK